MALGTTRVILQDFQRRYETIDLPAGTTELTVPEGVTFSALGCLPTHAHHVTRDNGRTYRTCAMFVDSSVCRYCQTPSRACRGSR